MNSAESPTTNVILRQNVTAAQATESIPAESGGVVRSPKVDVIRDGQNVRMLKVQCPCGQLITIECLYE